MFISLHRTNLSSLFSVIFRINKHDLRPGGERGVAQYGEDHGLGKMKPLFLREVPKSVVLSGLLSLMLFFCLYGLLLNFVRFHSR